MMTKQTLYTLVACSALGLSGCVASDANQDTEGTTSDGTSEDGSSSSTSTSGTSNSSTSDDGTTGTDDTTSGTTGGEEADCQPFGNPCADGFKCSPYSNNDDVVWNDNKCVPVDAQPAAVGDECTVMGSPVTGYDNCDGDSWCWADEKTLKGTCIELCGGTPDAPTCQGVGTVCQIANDGVLPVCLPMCDPSAINDCGDGQACYDVGGTFQCAADESEEGLGNPGDPCGIINGCHHGASCVPGAKVPGCSAEYCCTEWCNTTDADPDAACTQAGQSCTAYWAQGAEIAGYEHLGLCALPE